MGIIFKGFLSNFQQEIIFMLDKLKTYRKNLSLLNELVIFITRRLLKHEVRKSLVNNNFTWEQKKMIHN